VVGKNSNNRFATFEQTKKRTQIQEEIHLNDCYLVLYLICTLLRIDDWRAFELFFILTYVPSILRRKENCPMSAFYTFQMRLN
jgi:hypothetical protein